MNSQILQADLADAVTFMVLATTWLMILRVSNVVHFAHGTTYLIGAYVGFAVLPRAGWWVAFLAVMLGAGAFGYLCEKLIYAPFARRGAASWSILIASLAIFILGENTLGMIFGSLTKTVTHDLQKSVHISALGGFEIDRIHFVYVAVGLAWIAALAYTLTRTNMGLYFRAVASDQVLAELNGVPTPRVRALVFAVGSAAVGVVGLLRMIDVGAELTLGFTGIFFAFVPAIASGARSLRACVLMAMATAVWSHAAGYWWGQQWILISVFVPVALAVVCRPFLVAPQVRDI